MALPRPQPAGSELRFPALVWALLHAPIFLLLFAPSIGPALRSLPSGYRTPMWPALALEAAALSLLVFLVPLPLSVWGRAYRVGAPLVAGLTTVLLSADARLYGSIGFHMNGLFLRTLRQPAALHEMGIPTGEAAWLVLQWVAWVVADTAAGAWFLRHFAVRRRVWPWAAALFLAAVAERHYVASLTFFGGQAVFAAGQVLPLQAPVRMNAIWARLTGRPVVGNPLRAVSSEAALKLPPGLDPREVRFTRKPDVLLLLLESLRADYLVPEVMPRLLRRAAAQGTVFEQHYASAPTTFFGVYSLLFGYHAHTYDAALGTGRRPLLFAALSANGYHSRVLAASSVDWMGMRQGVFGDVEGELETDWPKTLRGDQRDEAIVERAKRHVLETPPDRPVFLFLFFFGTHFNYFFTPRSDRFHPMWDGEGVLKTSVAPTEHLLNRGRNAAYELDWKVDDFLTWFETTRGGDPGAAHRRPRREMREKGT
jgi:membrane-anchored protein YejM (alkaline phosphatase superfamily)